MSDERALDCLRDCIRRSRPRGPGALSDGESRPARPQHDQATPHRKRRRRSAGQVGRGSSSRARARQFRSSPIGGAERVPRPDGPENFHAHAWTVDNVAERSGRFGSVAVSVPSLDGHERRPGRRLAQCRRLFGDRSPTADRCLHRSIAGRAQHHRAQLAHRPPARERHWTRVQGNARSDRGRARHDR